MFCIDNHIGRREGVPSSWVKYDTLVKDLAENYGFAIENYKNPGDSPSLSLNGFDLWQCKEGWVVAKVVNNRYTNHAYFNQGRVRHDDMFPGWTPYDLENAINYVLVLGGDMELLGDIVEAIEGIVMQFFDIGEYHEGYENGCIISENTTDTKCIFWLAAFGKVEQCEKPDLGYELNLQFNNANAYQWTPNSEYHSSHKGNPELSSNLMVEQLPKGTRLWHLLDTIQDCGMRWCYINNKTLYNHDHMSVRKDLLDVLLRLKFIEPIAPLAQEYIWSKTSKYFHLNPVSE